MKLGAMAMKGCSVFLKTPALLEPHHEIVWCHIQDTHCGGPYPFTEVQSVYSTTPADWASLNSEFSFWQFGCRTKTKEPSLLYYLPIAGERIIEFPSVLALCEMQSTSSRIWTCSAVSNSYDGNHYTTGTSKMFVNKWLLLSNRNSCLES